MLPDLQAKGRRVLLFSQHTTMLDLLEHFVGDGCGGLGLRYLRLDGQTPQAERQLMIDPSPSPSPSPNPNPNPSPNPNPNPP